MLSFTTITGGINIMGYFKTFWNDFKRVFRQEFKAVFTDGGVIVVFFLAGVGYARCRHRCILQQLAAYQRVTDVRLEIQALGMAGQPVALLLRSHSSGNIHHCHHRPRMERIPGGLGTGHCAIPHNLRHSSTERQKGSKRRITALNYETR